jgi:hypothetical protein
MHMKGTIDQMDAFIGQITDLWKRLGLFLLVTWLGYVLGEMSKVVDLNEKHEWVFDCNVHLNPAEWVASIVLDTLPFIFGVAAMGVLFIALVVTVFLDGQLFRWLCVAFSVQCLAQTCVRSGIGILLFRYGDTYKMESFMPIAFFNRILCLLLLSFAIRSWYRGRSS